MPRGAPARKLAISVDQDVHAKVLKAAAEDRVSVSAWLTEAAQRAIRSREGLAAVAAWEAEYGAFTDQELAAARMAVATEITSRRPRKAVGPSRRTTSK